MQTICFAFQKFQISTNLHKEVEQAKERNDDSYQGCGDQDDNTSTQHIEHRAQEHLKNLGDHCVNGVHLLGKAVDQVPAGGSLKKGHR